MPYTDVYIADIDGFNWDAGHAPHRESPFVPQGGKLFDSLIKRIESGDLQGKKVDWGAWVAIMKKDQIAAIVTKHINGAISEPSTCISTNKVSKQIAQQEQDQIDDIYRFIEALEPDKDYGVVCAEL